VARALLSSEPELRKTALAAACAMVSRSYRGAQAALPVPDGTVVVADVLRSLTPQGYSRAEQARALVALGDALVEAAAAAMATSPEQALAVAQIASTDLGALLDAQPAEPLPAALEQALTELAGSVAERAVPGFAVLARHPSVEVRKRAVEFLAGRPEAAARAAVVEALSDPDPGVRKAALSSVERVEHAEPIEAMVALLREASDWSVRARAAKALGRLRSHPPEATLQAEIEQALAQAARTDPFALVREAALRSLARRSPAAAAPVLDELGRTDPEPRVRAIAAELRGQAATAAP